MLQSIYQVYQLQKLIKIYNNGTLIYSAVGTVNILSSSITNNQNKRTIHNSSAHININNVNLDSNTVENYFVINRITSCDSNITNTKV